MNLVDKDNNTLRESPLFYLAPGTHSAPTLPCLDSSSSTNHGLSIGASAGLAVGLILVLLLLVLGGGWRLRHCLQHRSAVRKRASLRASIRHLVPQTPVMEASALYNIPGRAPSQACGHDGEPRGQKWPSPYMPFHVYTDLPASSRTCARTTPGHGSASPPRPARPSSSIYSLDDLMGHNALFV